jgi:hypothetical protein
MCRSPSLARLPVRHAHRSQVAAQINSAVGDSCRSHDDNRVPDHLTQGRRASSVTVRAGGSANTARIRRLEQRVPGHRFGLPWSGPEQQHDDLSVGRVDTWPVSRQRRRRPSRRSSARRPASVSSTAAPSPEAQTADISYSGGGSILLQAGDIFYADGVRSGRGRHREEGRRNRFKLGVLNVSKSIFDASGNVVTAVYDDVNINTLLARHPVRAAVRVVQG